MPHAEAPGQAVGRSARGSGRAALPSGVTSSSVASAPDWMRLMSRSEPTSRFSRSASSSMARAVARRCSSSSSIVGSARLPAAARIAASGVRRSWTPSRAGPIAARRCGARPRHPPPPRRGGRAGPPGPPGRPSPRAAGSPRSSARPHRPVAPTTATRSPRRQRRVRPGIWPPSPARRPPCGSGPTSLRPRDARAAGRRAFRPCSIGGRMPRRRSGARSQPSSRGRPTRASSPHRHGSARAPGRSRSPARGAVASSREIAKSARASRSRRSASCSARAGRPLAGR